MFLWAGIDEAGYGPLLGPLVVAGTAFTTTEEVRPGALWDALGDAVVRRARGSDGRLIVNDSKLVHSGRHGLRRLEEGVLGFLSALTGRPLRTAGDPPERLANGRQPADEPQPWFSGTEGLSLPVASNASAIGSRAAALAEALDGAGIRLVAAHAVVVLPPEFNRVVARTRNKSLLLFQKCGLLLQDFERIEGVTSSRVLVDRHGGRMRYRRLLRDAFPECDCDVLAEEAKRSTYRITRGEREMAVSFRQGGDRLALPTALASMVAKYIRELYMRAFNAHWAERMEALAPTAGYHKDALRFLRDTAPLIREDGIDPATLVRAS